MNQSPNTFYVTGGTLRRDAPSYVPRQADQVLYEGLRQGRFCYVLTSRQMGKSSLMVRTAARLREEGATVAILDLTRIGQNLTPEQWYDGLLGQLGEQFNLGEELESFWLSRDRLGPLDRWMRAVREIVLPRRTGQIVIFVDEIDAVRSLPFSTDEFFAAIRECYNRRTEAPDLARLTFCLLGVATPSDLIRDTRTTPFNIGQRIELNDFTEVEAASLAEGLGRDQQTAQKLLRRVLYWTSGHPYLTQRLCQAIAEDAAVSAAGGVDRLCEELFFTPRARERDDNLLFVRERMLRSEGDLARLLDLYSQVLRHRRVRDDETNSSVGILLLSGVARVAEGFLQVRNRIYDRVFDQQWITSNMPDAELQRQRAAYRRGILRTSAIAGVIVLAFAALTIFAFRLNYRAEEQRNQAESQRNIALQQEYSARMILASTALAEGNINQVDELLNAYLKQPGRPDLRGFEWYYLWHGFHKESVSINALSASSVAFTPDGKAMIVANPDNKSISFWDLSTQQLSGLLDEHAGVIHCIATSFDGSLLATGDSQGNVKVWNLPSRHLQATISGHAAEVSGVTISPDNKMLASMDRKNVKLWEITTGRLVAELTMTPSRQIGYPSTFISISFLPAGKLLALQRVDEKILEVWDVVSGQFVTIQSRHNGYVSSATFSPNGEILATGGFDNAIILWNTATGQFLGTLSGHELSVESLAFSPEGKTLASASDDKTIVLWDTVNMRLITSLRQGTGGSDQLTFSPDGSLLASHNYEQVTIWDVSARRLPTTTRIGNFSKIDFWQPKETTMTLTGHASAVASVAFSANGKILASGSDDKSVKLWDAATSQLITTLIGHTEPVSSVVFSPEGKTLVSGSRDGTVKLWDVVSGQLMVTFTGHGQPVNCVVFSPDGKSIASGSNDNTLKLWNVSTGKIIATYTGHDGQITSISFSPDGYMLASGGRDETVRLWDIRTGKQIASLTTKAFYVNSIAFSPSGKTLAVGGQDKTIMLWDIQARQKVAIFKGHPLAVSAVAFSPNGKTLASAGQDETIRLWNIATGQQVATLSGHEAAILSLSFSPNSSALASGGQDKTIKLWRAATEEEVQRTIGVK